MLIRKYKIRLKIWWWRLAPHDKAFIWTTSIGGVGLIGVWIAYLITN